MQPDENTVHDARSPAASTDATIAGSSSAGSVFGIATTAVKPPSAAGACSGLDRLGFLHARLAQVHVEVDEPGRDDAARRVEDLVTREPAPDLDDVPAAHQHVGDAFAPLVDDASAPNDDRQASATS